MTTPIDTLYLLEQFYDTLRAGQHFLHAHDYSEEEGSLYNDLGSAAKAQLYRARRLSPLPKKRPFSLMFYRQAFHHHLSCNGDFLSALADRKRNLDLYFRDMEKVVRLTFDRLVEGGDLSRAVMNQPSYRTAFAVTQHLPYWYFRGMTMSAAIAQLTGEDAYDPELTERTEDALWAVDLACAYTAAYLSIDFHASHIVMAEKGPWTCDYTTQQCNIVYEAGYHLAQHITTQVSPYIEALGGSHAQLTTILSDELGLVALQQAHSALVPDLNRVETIGQLVNDAVTHYEPTLLYNLKRRCEELNTQQRQATYAMQLALSGTEMQPVKVGPLTVGGAAADAFEATGLSHLVPEEDGDQLARFRDLDIESGMSADVGSPEPSLPDLLGVSTNASVIEAGETIIEYLRKMTFSGPDREEEKDVTDKTGQPGGSDDDAQDRELQEEEWFYAMEYECVVQGQGKVRRKMLELLSAIQAGLQITFASQAQAKGFAKAAMVHEPKQAEAIDERNVRFVEKGQVQSFGTEGLQQMRKEAEPEAQKKQQLSRHHEHRQDKDALKEAMKEQRKEQGQDKDRPHGQGTAQTLAKAGRNSQSRLRLRTAKVLHSLTELKESKEQGVSVKDARKSATDRDGDGIPDFMPKGRGR